MYLHILIMNKTSAVSQIKILSGKLFDLIAVETLKPAIFIIFILLYVKPYVGLLKDPEHFSTFTFILFFILF
jgi:hypothetical protein